MAPLRNMFYADALLFSPSFVVAPKQEVIYITTTSRQDNNTLHYVVTTNGVIVDEISKISVRAPN